MENINLSDNMKMLGEAILFSSIQFAIGSVEMSSKFSVKNFSKDQETIQNAADALADYLKIGMLWTLGVTLLLFCNYGTSGAIVSLAVNLIIILWIYVSYMESFKIALIFFLLSSTLLFERSRSASDVCLITRFPTGVRIL
jgi:hypothetical protein